jgi:mono/diheme cytochrome c family protein
MAWTKTRNRVTRAAGIAALAAAALSASGCAGNSGEDDANLVAGKQLFVKKCGSCHVLGRAGTKGNTGPNLDAAFQVARAERWGDGGIRGAVHERLGQLRVVDVGTGPAQQVAVEDEDAHPRQPTRHRAAGPIAKVRRE